MRILHVADLHLAPRLAYIEDRDRRARRREDFALVTGRLPELVREQGAACVLVAGDVFDRDLPALPEVGRLARALEACAVPVLVVPGTHDPWRKGGVWDRAWPPNVTIFKEDRWTVHRLGPLAVYGLASVGRPLPGRLFETLPTRAPDARWHVGLVHASLLWSDVRAKVDAKNFPFEEPELDRTGLDYVALGDHHRTRVVRRPTGVVAAYPGSPEGLGFDPAEAGPRHVLVVDLDAGEARVTEQPVNLREVVVEQVDVESLEGDSPGDMAEAVRRRIAARAGPDRLGRFELVGILHEPLALDLAAIEDGCRDDWFLLQVRDRTRTMPRRRLESGTIRAAFEARMEARIAAAGDGDARDLAETALKFGLQALEGLQL
jgi:DNA repair exonuclease SbcCD nuclease subunit